MRGFTPNRFITALLMEFALAEGDREEALECLTSLKTMDRLRENYYQWRINRL